MSRCIPDTKAVPDMPCMILKILPKNAISKGLLVCSVLFKIWGKTCLAKVIHEISLAVWKTAEVV